MQDLQFTKQDRYSRKEDNLEEEIEQAKALLDGVTEKLREKKLKVTPDVQCHLQLLGKTVANRAEVQLTGWSVR